MNKEKMEVYNGASGGTYTIVESDGVVYVNATELSKPYGKHPYQWLDNKEAQEIIAEAAKSKKMKKSELVIKEGRKATWMCEDVALEFALWVRPYREVLKIVLASHIKQAKNAFENIRREAEHKAKPKRMNIFQRNEEAEKEAEKRKVEYCNNVLASKSTYTVSQIAKELGWSAIRLNEWLHCKGIQYKQRGQWLLYAKYQDRGYVKIVTFIQEQGDKNNSFQATQWTEKGRKFIHELVKNHKQDEETIVEEVPKVEGTLIIEEKKESANCLSVEPPTYKELEEMLDTYANKNDKLEADNKFLREELEFTRKRTETFRIIIMNMLSSMGVQQPDKTEIPISIT